VTAASHNITAVYSGGTNHDPSTSNTLAYVINACTANPVVLNTSDGTAPVPAGSLREAIINACPGNTITFDAAVTGQINLTAALPDISKNLTITGPGANVLEVRGSQTLGNSYRVFNVTSGVTVNISSLTMNNGSDALGGGGVNNAGTLTLTECAIGNASTSSGNNTTGSGGGIQNSGTLNLIRSTVSNNVASLNGGGIYNTGTLNITNSTISTNTANVVGVSAGGGIYNSSGVNTVTLLSSTVANNTSDASGGGIFNAGGTVNFGNTIVADNNATASKDLAGAGTFNSQDYNLFENFTVVFTGTTTHDKTGVDPQLGALQNNGGTTFTHSILANGSPAMDAGNTTLTVDQRGQPREVDNLSVTNAAGGDASDIGAYEAPAPPSAPDLDAASDTGSGNSDDNTSDNTPTFTIGGVVTGATVDLLIDGVQVATGTVNTLCLGVPCIQLTSTTVADGPHVVVARQIVAGGTSPTSTGLNLTIDTAAPTINIGAPSQSSANSSSTVTYEITYGGADSVTLADGNITLNTTGTAGASPGVSGSGTTTRTVTLNGITGDGTLGISIASGTASDTAGNLAPAAGSSATFTVDASKPTVSMNSAAGNPTSTSPIPVTVTFNESVTGFTSADITAGNGTVSNFAGSGASYTFDLTPTGQGLVTADIAADVAADAGSNGNTAATQFSRTFDSVAPTASITAVSPDPRNTSVSSITIVFSEAITGFDLADLSLKLDGGANLLTGAQTLTSVDNITWTLDNLAGLTGAAGSYQLTLTASGSGIADTTTNVMTSDASDSWVVDTTAPTIAVTTPTSPTTDTTINFTVTFTEAVTGFDSTDVDFTGSTATGALAAVVTGSGPYNVAVSGMTGPGDVTITINASAAADGAGNGNSNSDTGTVAFIQDNSTTLVVNSKEPTDDGSCDALGTGPGNQDCTLPEAVNAANLDFGAETITFDSTVFAAAGSPYTIQLGSELFIDDDVTITGPVASRVIVSGEDVTRVFSINTGKTVSISNLTIANGRANVGGGIYNLGNLTITNSTLRGNKAVEPFGDGGAIDSDNGTLTIINSTISGNTANGGGGGIHHCGGSTATLTNVTITGNRANADDASPGEGGGIEQVSSSTITLNNTIVAGNFKGTASPVADDVSVLSFPGVGALSGSNNLIGVDTGLSGISNGSGGNQVGTAGTPINALLGAFASNGGPVQTHLLLPGSPAINAGSNALAKDQNNNNLTTDQRGTGFSRIINTTVDIGAVEVNYAITPGTNTTPQSTVINTAFATALAVTIKESGNPQSGLSVTFTAPGVGASGTFAASSTVATDINGVATAPAFTANATVGGYLVTASLTGGAPSTTFSLTNTKAGQAITFGALANKTFGDPAFTVSATGGASGNPVTFSSQTAAVCTVSGNTVTIVAAGTCTIRASQAGNNDYDAAANVDQSFTIGKANQTVTFGALADKSFGDADFTVSATASSTLAVSFAATGNCTVTGSTVHLTGAGSCTITASQAGNSNFNAAADVPQSFTVAKASQTITFGALANKSFGDADFTVSATASSTLAVSFAASGQCTVTGSTVHLTGAGSCTITASQAGNSNFNAAADVPQTFQIAKAATTTAVTSSVNPSAAGQNVTFTATVTSGAGTPTGMVQFKVDGSNSGAPVALNASGVATFSTSSFGVGTTSVAAEYLGDANFTGSTGSLVGGQIVNVQTSLSINDVSVTEGDSGTKSFVFTVTLGQASNLSVTVDFATANDTATAGSDYQSQTGTLTFNPGELTKTVSVVVNGDTVNEANETFFVNLSNAVNSTIGDNQGLGTILNDDGPGVQFSTNSFTFSEGAGHGNIIVTRTGDLSAPLTVDYITSDQSALTPCQTNTNGFASDRCDYATAAGSLSFAAGEAQKTIALVLIDDAYVEPSEQLTITLSNAQGGTLGLPVAATITITDNDSQVGTANPIDDLDFFIRQQYIDFLGREPEQAGFDFWKARMTSCPAGQVCDRIDTSLRFFISDEFRERGYFVYLFYHAGLGRRPTYAEWIMDVSKLNGPKTVAEQAAARAQFINEFMSRQEFQNFYNSLQTAETFVDGMIQKSGVTPASRQTLINNYAAIGRGATWRAFMETPEVQAAFVDRAFVTMLYFGYLRRDAEPGGFTFWMQRLNQSNQDYRLLVGGFLQSHEYRFRFALIPTP
jgi:hypothetical protein